MNVGMDLGYSWTKAVGGDRRRAGFPSLVGTPDQTRFSLNGAREGITLLSPRHVQIGDLALIGCDVCGRFRAYRSGHQLNREIVRKLKAESRKLKAAA